MRHCRFHDLRVVFASILAKRNLPPKIAQRLMGHANISMTLDLYARFSRDDEPILDECLNINILHVASTSNDYNSRQLDSSANPSQPNSGSPWPRLSIGKGRLNTKKASCITNGVGVRSNKE